MVLMAKFGEVDDHSQTVGMIIGKMETNLQEIQAVNRDLLSVFQGASAEDYKGVTARLTSETEEYHQALTRVKIAITQTAGSGGLLQVADKNGAGLISGAWG